MKKMTLLFFVLSLSGCATKYQTMGLTGGVDSQQITSDRYRIVARGNGYTSSVIIQDYVLLKAAETTKSAGATHFVVLGANDASSTVVSQTAGYSQTNFVGRSAFTTYNPGSTFSTLKPGQDVYIQVFKLKPNEAPPVGATSADEVIKFVSPRVLRAEE